MRRSVLLLGGGLAVAATVGCATSSPKRAERGLWDRTRVQVALQLADEHIKGGRFDRARALLAAHAHGADERLQLTLVRIDLEEGRYAAAARRLEEIPAEGRDSILYHEASAVAHEGLGRWSAAAAAYECAYRREPSTARLLAWLETMVLAGQSAEARAALEAERGRFPGRPALQEFAGRLHVQLGDAEAAIRELQSALLSAAESVALRRQLARAYMTAERFVEAAAIWRDLAASTSSAPQRRDFRDQWALSLLAAGKYAEAAQVYRIMTLTQPDDVGARVGLATAALADGRPAEAVPAARHALRLDADNAAARLALACGYARLNQHGKAVEVLADSPRSADTDALVRELLARWRPGQPAAVGK